MARKIALRLLLGTLLATVLVPASLGAQGDPNSNRRGAHRDLAAARRATAPFHNPERAREAGYPGDATGCLDFPDGYLNDGPGAMSAHWVNFAHYRDGGAPDPARPGALLYEPLRNGTLRLMAVEYIIPERDRPRTAPPPVLFDREMQFHPQFGAWALHVWLWKHNPYGLYADVNPNVTCDFAPPSALLPPRIIAPVMYGT